MARPWSADDIERRIQLGRLGLKPEGSHPAEPREAPRRQRKAFEPRRPDPLPQRLNYLEDPVRGVPAYGTLLELQDGLCALCFEMPRMGDRFHFDHDHRCHPSQVCRRCFRGLLCRRCNSGLGLVDRVGLAQIHRYLGEFDLDLVLDFEVRTSQEGS